MGIPDRYRLSFDFLYFSRVSTTEREDVVAPAVQQDPAEPSPIATPDSIFKLKFIITSTEALPKQDLRKYFSKAFGPSRIKWSGDKRGFLNFSRPGSNERVLASQPHRVGSAEINITRLAKR